MPDDVGGGLQEADEQGEDHEPADHHSASLQSRCTGLPHQAATSWVPVTGLGRVMVLPHRAHVTAQSGWAMKGP